MSEADNTWQVDIEGSSHQIEVHHNTMTGKLLVELDGRAVGQDRLLMRDKSVEMEIDGHTAVVAASLRYGGFAAGSELHLDGRYVEPRRR